jgi:hypothetical protein
VAVASLVPAAEGSSGSMMTMMMMMLVVVVMMMMTTAVAFCEDFSCPGFQKGSTGG